MENEPLDIVTLFREVDHLTKFELYAYIYTLYTKDSASANKTTNNEQTLLLGSLSAC